MIAGLRRHDTGPLAVAVIRKLEREAQKSAPLEEATLDDPIFDDEEDRPTTPATPSAKVYVLCRDCGGKGRIEKPFILGGALNAVSCAACKGSGHVPKSEPPPAP